MMGRQPCCDKIGLKRSPWTIEEDQKLMDFILSNGIHCWRLVPRLAGLMRCGKSCRLRWTNYLRPDLKRGALSEEEEDQIIQLHSRLGNRWSKIASHFPGRTDNEIKNHWNTRIKKRLKLLGLDALTHKPLEVHAEQSLRAVRLDASNQGNLQLHNEKEQSTTEVILNGCRMEKTRMDVEEMKPQSDLSSSCCTSLSLDDTLHPSSVEGDSLLEGSSWMENIDSFPAWDSFCHLEDILSFEN